MHHDVAVPSQGRFGAQSSPVGVIDIGSNSIRLVVFEALQRNPVPLFNEKVLCAIGRNLGSTGLLDPEGLRRARESLERFCKLAHGMRVSQLQVVATAAVRDARNGDDFVAEATALCGVPVRVLSGDEEARISAQGVICGIPDARGVVGDLGGGSLELVEVSEGRFGRSVTLPLGPLRLMDQAKEKIPDAREIVDKAFAHISWLAEAAGRNFYAVGGAWRSLARVHMEQRNYPLHVLHHYEIKADDAQRVARLIAGLGRKSLASMSGMSKRRIDTMPYGALVLERLMAAGRFEKVVVSAFGLREGLLYELMSAQERRRDPLIEAAREIAQVHARSPAHVEELMEWTAALFAGESAEERRLRQAAALLSDIDWRGHPDYRADEAFHTVLRAPFAGIDHGGRAFLALCIYHRYGGGEEGQTSADALKAVAGSGQAARAAMIGAALRLGHILCASSPGILPRCTLARDKRRVVLSLPKSLGALMSETVRKRLGTLAEAMDLASDVEVTAE